MSDLEARVTQLETQLRAVENVLLCAVLTADLFEERTVAEVCEAAEVQAKAAERVGNGPAAVAIRDLLSALRSANSPG